MATKKAAGYAGLIDILKDEHGYTGSNSVDDVLAFAGEKGIDLPARKELETARKEMMQADVRENDAGGFTIDLIPSGEAEDDIEEQKEGELDEEAEKRLRSNSAAIKSLRNEVRAMSEQFRAKTPVASVSLPGEKRWQKEKLFGRNVFETAQDANDFGNWVLATPEMAQKRPERAEQAKKALAERGIKTNTTRFGEDGGYLVPEQFIADIWSYDTAFGVARMAADIHQMNSDSATRPKSTGVGGGFVAYWNTEGTAPTLSNLALKNVRLNARPLTVLGKMSRELIDDSPINVGEFAARKIAEVTEQAEDEAVFNGDGTNTYGGVNGILSQFGKTTATNDLRSVTGGGTAEGHSKANIRSLMGKVGRRYRAGSAWFCHPVMSSVVIDSLAGEFGGGITLQEVEGFGFIKRFLGYPVIEVEVMPDTIAPSGGQIDLLFGNLSAAVMLGDRQAFDVEFNPHRYWDEGNIGVRGNHRVALNVHELGNVSESVSSPLVALYQS